MKKAITPIVVSTLAAIFAIALGKHSREFLGVPLPWLLVPYSLLVQIIAFIPALLNNTEKYYDLTGSLTFLSITSIALLTNPSIALEQFIAGLMVIVWAGRLGSFLFLRILKAKEDSRFREIKKTKIRFFYAWLIQGLWVVITMSPLLAVNTAASVPSSGRLSAIEIVGILVWILGMSIEVISDRQKSNFNDDPNNKEKFISVGLWAYSRHPNYVGEIVLWLGATIFAWSSLQGWQNITLICPIFVYLLLSRLSGVPLLEQKAEKRWGSDASYQ